MRLDEFAASEGLWCFGVRHRPSGRSATRFEIAAGERPARQL